MLFRKDILFLTKPLYEGEFSRKTSRPPTLPDFLRFHAATSNGKIQEEVTYNSLNTFAEWFFADFNRITDTPRNDDDQREICDVSASYRLWKAPISRSSMGPGILSEEGLVVNFRRPKHLFTERDARRLLRTPWTEDGINPVLEPVQCWNYSGAGINSAGMSPVPRRVQCWNKSSGRQPSSIATDTLSKL